MDTATIAPPPDNRRGWPKTPDGTTDWTVVFEDPDNGIIPLIDSARTTVALRESTVVVISTLYSRKDDQAEAARMTGELDRRIAEAADVIDARAVIIEVLHGIKDRRIRIAEKYIEDKKRENLREAPRKGATETATPKSNAEERPGTDHGKIWIAAAAAMALLIVAVLWFVLIGDQPVSPDDEIAEAPNNDVDHLKPPEPAPPKPKKAAKPAPPPQDPLEFTVKPIYWTGAAAAGRQKHLYAPTLRATDSTLVRTLCIRLPQVVETIQLQLLSEHPQDHMATPAELKAIGARTTRAINEKLGKSVVAEIRFTVGAGPRKGEPRPVALARRCGQ